MLQTRLPQVYRRTSRETRLRFPSRASGGIRSLVSDRHHQGPLWNERRVSELFSLFPWVQELTECHWWGWTCLAWAKTTGFVIGMISRRCRQHLFWTTKRITIRWSVFPTWDTVAWCTNRRQICVRQFLCLGSFQYMMHLLLILLEKSFDCKSHVPFSWGSGWGEECLRAHSTRTDRLATPLRKGPKPAAGWRTTEAILKA